MLPMCYYGYNHYSNHTVSGKVSMPWVTALHMFHEFIMSLASTQ